MNAFATLYCSFRCLRILLFITHDMRLNMSILMLIVPLKERLYAICREDLLYIISYIFTSTICNLISTFE